FSRRGRSRSGCKSDVECGGANGGHGATHRLAHARSAKTVEHASHECGSRIVRDVGLVGSAVAVAPSEDMASPNFAADGRIARKALALFCRRPAPASPPGRPGCNPLDLRCGGAATWLLVAGLLLGTISLYRCCG